MMRWPFFLLLLALPACNSGSKSRPLAEAVDNRRSGDPTPVKEDKVEKPTATDPAAKEIINKLLAAHTGGKPELLEQVKNYRGNRRGKMTITDITNEATMTVAARWPDGYRSEFRTAPTGTNAYIFGFSKNVSWQLNGMGGMTSPQPLDEILAGIVTADIAAEWTTMVVPLTDPATLATVVNGETIDGKPATAIRAWVNNVPLVVVVDPATGCISRVRYQVKELGGLAPKAMHINELQTINGIKLPLKMEYLANSRVQANWLENKFEFPKPTPPAEFEKP